MDAIFSSCKVYRSSTRKSEIRAAVEDPRNKELVQQLREYVDPEYRARPASAPSTPKVPAGSSDTNSNPAATSPRSVPNFHPSSYNPNSHKTDNKDLSEEDDETLSEKFERMESEELAEGNPEDNMPVDESTKLTGNSITSGTVLYTDSNVVVNRAAEDVASIEGLLNSRQDTCGVSRILVKEDEFWIYYNDKINLNNVMEAVISLLNSAGYTYLDFNRLARTDNAIVFQILATTPDIQPIKDEADGSKK